MLHKEDPFFQIFKSAIQSLPHERKILDIGTPARFHKEVGLVKNQISQSQYFALGFSVDSSTSNHSDIDGDIQSLPIQSQSLGGVICLEVLEHVCNPKKAVDEIFRILQPGGTAIVTTPFLFPYHGKKPKNTDPSHDNYPDLWRFTFQGLEELFRTFNTTITPFTNTIEHYLYHTPIQYVPFIKSTLFRNFVSKIKKTRLDNPTHRYLTVAVRPS